MTAALRRDPFRSRALLLGAPGLRDELIHRSSLIQLAVRDHKQTAPEVRQLAQATLDWWGTEARRCNVEIVSRRGVTRRQGKHGRRLWTAQPSEDAADQGATTYGEVNDVAQALEGLFGADLGLATRVPVARARKPRRAERDAMVIHLARIQDVAGSDIGRQWQALVDWRSPDGVLKRRPEMTLAFCEWLLLSPRERANSSLDESEIAAILRRHERRGFFVTANPDDPMETQ